MKTKSLIVNKIQKLRAAFGEHAVSIYSCKSGVLRSTLRMLFCEEADFVAYEGGVAGGSGLKMTFADSLNKLLDNKKICS